MFDLRRLAMVWGVGMIPLGGWSMANTREAEGTMAVSAGAVKAGPIRPASVTVVAVTSTTATVAWEESAGAISYELVASFFNENPPRDGREGYFIIQKDLTGTSRILTGLEPNHLYSFLVRACDVTKECSDYTLSSATVTWAAVPKDLYASEVKDTHVELGWSDGWNYSQRNPSFVFQYSNNPDFSNPQEYTSSRNVNKLLPLTHYFFRVAAINDIGVRTDFSEPLQIITAPPKPVAFLVVELSTTSLSATWKTVNGAESYNLSAYYGGTPNHSSRLFSANGLKENHGALSDLIPGVGLSVYVEACDGKGQCSDTADLFVVTPPSPPDMSYDWSTLTDSSVQLIWGTRNKHFLIQKSLDINFITPETLPVEADGKYTWRGLSANTIYYLRIAELNSVGVISDYSKALRVRTKPKAPTGLLVQASAVNAIAQWDAADQIAYYKVWASTPNGLSVIQPRTNPTAPQATLSPLTPNTTYFIHVQACNSEPIAGCSEETLSAEVVTLPGSPAMLWARESAPGVLNLEWNRSAAEDYVVQQSANPEFISPVELSTSSTRMSIADLRPNQVVYFRVAGRRGASVRGDYSEILKIKIAPAIPAELTVVNVTSTTATVRWTPVEGADHYNLLLDPPPYFIYLGKSIKGVTTTTLTIFNLSPNMNYSFGVAACHESACSTYSLGLESATWATVPTDVEVTAVSDTSAALAWKEGVPPLYNFPASSYIVQRSAESDFTHVETVGTSTSRSTLVQGLTPEKLYFFRVASVNQSGIPTEYSAAASRRTLAPGPDELSVEADSTTAKVNWNAVTGATRYTLSVFRNYNVNPPSTLPVWTGSFSEPTGRVSGLQLNQTYYFFVNACDAAGVCSAFSVSRAIVTPLNPPTRLSVTDLHSDRLTLSWGANGNPSTFYTLEQSIDGGISYSPLQTIAGTSFVVKDLHGDGTFYFRVFTTNAAGVKTDASVVGPVRLPPPDPGHLTTAKGSVATEVVVSWEAVIKADYYRLLASESSTDETGMAVSTRTTDLTTRLGGLSANTSYYLFVKACRNDDACSTPLPFEGPVITPANKITAIKIGHPTPDSINLVWDPNGNREGSVYWVEMSLPTGLQISSRDVISNPNNEPAPKWVPVYQGIDRSAFVSGLVSRQSYQFRVIVAGIDGTLVPSEPVTILAGAGYPDVNAVRVFPNPFRSGNGAEAITVDHLPNDATIKIYTLRGELVKTITALSEESLWDIRNDGGESVASGVYLMVIEGGGNKKSVKIVVQR